MAKQGANTLEGHLVSARTRAHFAHVEGGSLDTVTRFWALEKSLKALVDSTDHELFRYFPVAVIAVLESHFKLTIKAFVDNGSPYLERGLGLVKDRLKAVPDFLPILHRKTISIGELVAHQLNSLASIEEPFSVLLDQNFKNLLRAVRDPWQVRNESDSPPIVENIENLWRSLAKAFEQRHIIAHEAAPNFTVTYEDAKNALECVQIFTGAVDALLWGTIWLDVPLNQREMNMHAWKVYRETRLRFSNTLRRAYVIAKERGEQKDFCKLHRIWLGYARRWANMEEEGFGPGSMRPMIAASVRNSLLEARAKEVSDWISLRQP